MNILEMIREENSQFHKPLAERMKPKKLEDFYGQEHLLKEGELLYELIKSDRLSSMILYGPAGVGKTSLAKIISEKTKSDFVSMNAVLSGVKDIRSVIERAQQNLETSGNKTLLFIDEIHRFNKAQQDALLYHVEQGTITLIGVTTENPYYEVNPALISRSAVFQLKTLSEESLIQILKRALSKDIILQSKQIHADDQELHTIALLSDGDARRALNILETASVLSKNGLITDRDVQKALQEKTFHYDKNADEHYDTISAFIKSVRGSDPDAALYYLAKMLRSGEDPKFIARRLLVLSSEDIGLADPQAMVLANAAFDSVHKLGMPEARIPLSEITIYLALAEKSNSAYLAINQAMDYVKNNPQKSVPRHLEDSTKKRLSKNEEHYLYAHDYKNHYVKQQYLPDGVNETFYNACENEKELELNEQHKRRKHD